MDAVALMENAPAVADWTVTVVMGLGIAATCGLRAFLPLLAVNLLALTGHVTLHESFAFLGTWPATVMFGVATVAETLGDKVPGVDHFMDAYGVVVKPTAATITAAAFIADVDPLVALALGLIGGGTTAGVLGVAKAKVRAVTSLASMGIGNPVVSVVEDAVAVTSVTLVAIAPILGFGALMFFAGCAFAWVGYRTSHRKAVVAQGTDATG